MGLEMGNSVQSSNYLGKSTFLMGRFSMQDDVWKYLIEELNILYQAEKGYNICNCFY